MQNPREKYLASQAEDYEEETPYHSGRSRSKYYRSNEKYDKADDCESSEECTCSCSKCDDPPPRCKEECLICPTETEQSSHFENQPNVIFMSVPYLVMMSSNNTTSINGHTPTIAPQSSTTTTLSTKTSFTKSTVSNLELLTRSSNSYDGKNLNYQRPTSLKPRQIVPLRRTKPTWMPKFGIIPIPDQLAEKLMSQLKEIKSLRRLL